VRVRLKQSNDSLVSGKKTVPRCLDDCCHHWPEVIGQVSVDGKALTKLLPSGFDITRDSNQNVGTEG